MGFGAWWPWPVTAISPGIMGWYRFVPRMETYHGVLSMDHFLSGSIVVDGERFDFDDGRGYIEKDWGRSFPSSWIWAQSNNFGRPGVSAVVSVAKIPWMTSHFVGNIAGLLLDDDLHRFATYTGAWLAELKPTEAAFRIVLRDRSRELKVRTSGGVTGALKAPVLGAMEGRTDEAIGGVLWLRLRELGACAPSPCSKPSGRCRHRGHGRAPRVERRLTAAVAARDRRPGPTGPRAERPNGKPTILVLLSATPSVSDPRCGSPRPAAPVPGEEARGRAPATGLAIMTSMLREEGGFSTSRVVYAKNTTSGAVPQYVGPGRAGATTGPGAVPGAAGRCPRAGQSVSQPTAVSAMPRTSVQAWPSGTGDRVAVRLAGDALTTIADPAVVSVSGVLLTSARSLLRVYRARAGRAGVVSCCSPAVPRVTLDGLGGEGIVGGARPRRHQHGFLPARPSGERGESGRR